MKRIATVLMLVLLTILAACEKETVLSVDQTSISIPDNGGTQTVSLTANKPWTASSNQSWCKVSPSGGEEASSSRITITCDANTSYDARNASVTFTCAEKTISVNVSQAINNGLLVSQTEYNITNAAQQLEIPVQANVKFSVEVDNGCKDWVKYNTTKGLSNSTVVLDIAKNEAYDGREGKVTIKQTDGNLSATVVIKQGQLDGLFLTTSEYNLSNEKHTLTVEVKSNIEFEVKSEVEWIKYVETKGLKTNQIILDVAENDTFDVREGKVIVKQKNGTLIGAITIKQDEKYGILVSQSEYELSNEAQTIEVEVKYNVDYSVVIPSSCKDWIKQVSVKGLNSRVYTFSISKNATYDNREGSITFKQNNGAISTTVAITQAQTDYFKIDNHEYTVSEKEQIIEINIESNVDYQLTIADECKEWISEVTTKGLQSYSRKILVAYNHGGSRTGKIIIKRQSISEEIIIRQHAGVVEFDDAVFKAYCITNFDKNKDGEISLEEAKDVKSIKVYTDNISSMKGVKDFTNLIELACYGTSDHWDSTLGCDVPDGRLVSLDVSGLNSLMYLRCDCNQMTALDVSDCKSLKYLICVFCPLTSLDVSSCTALVKLDCSYSERLSNLNVSGCKTLSYLNCEFCQLNNLDMLSCSALDTLECSYNQLASLNVSGCNSLNVLRCHSNKLTDLNVSGCTALSELNCSGNRLTSIDISSCSMLRVLACDANQMTSIVIKNHPTLASLVCSSNPLTSLNVSGCNSLTGINYDHTPLISLDVSNTALTKFISIYNQKNIKSINLSGCRALTYIAIEHEKTLTDLNVSGCASLIDLSCGDCALTSLNVSGCTALERLSCYNNQLSSLNISGCNSLIGIACANNRLTSLDVSNNLKLSELYCKSNPLLTEIWFKKGQTIKVFEYDKDVATIKYK